MTDDVQNQQTLPASLPRLETKLEEANDNNDKVSATNGHQERKSMSDDGKLTAGHDECSSSLQRSSPSHDSPKDASTTCINSWPGQSLSKQDISNLDIDAAKSLVSEAQSCFSQLIGEMQHTQTLLSQAKLQIEMLNMETHDVAQRHQVETDIVQRQVDLLRMDPAVQLSPNQDKDTNYSNSPQHHKLSRKLEKANLDLRRANREIEIQSREIRRLRQQCAMQRQQASVPSSPVPDHPPKSPLDALGYLATQVLQQESGDTSSRNRFYGTSGHDRYQSLSPTRPSSRLPSVHDLLQSSPSIAAPHNGLRLSWPRTADDGSASPKRRRRSSASTISLTSDDDDDEEGGFNGSVVMGTNASARQIDALAFPPVENQQPKSLKSSPSRPGAKLKSSFSRLGKLNTRSLSSLGNKRLSYSGNASSSPTREEHNRRMVPTSPLLAPPLELRAAANQSRKTPSPNKDDDNSMAITPP